ncbi:hypothetical protein BKA69DRAFT_1101485 [Paraphysoderma sedebokerense]|nr:hypothetical protein BKA69DRAFT_1101485 [Paraphysoderma sedebokerense]
MEAENLIDRIRERRRLRDGLTTTSATSITSISNSISRTSIGITTSNALFITLPSPIIPPPPAVIAPPILPPPELSLTAPPSSTVVSPSSSVSLVTTTSSSQLTSIASSSAVSSSSFATSTSATTVSPTEVPNPPPPSPPPEGNVGAPSPQPSRAPNNGQSASNESISNSPSRLDESTISTEPYIIIGVIFGLIFVGMFGLIYRHKRRARNAVVNPSPSLPLTPNEPVFKFNQSPPEDKRLPLTARNLSPRDSMSSFGDTESTYTLAAGRESVQSNRQSSVEAVHNSSIERSTDANLNSYMTWESSEPGIDDQSIYAQRQEVIIMMQNPETADTRETMIRPETMI